MPEIHRYRATFEYMRMPAHGAIALKEPRGPFEVEVRKGPDDTWHAVLLPTKQRIHLGDKKLKEASAALRATEGCFRVHVDGKWAAFDKYGNEVEVALTR
jgi:hypothetical protein